jgi:hypothetical protein
LRADESGKFQQPRGVFHGSLAGESDNHVRLSTFQNQMMMQSSSRHAIKKDALVKVDNHENSSPRPSRITNWIRFRNSCSTIMASGMESSNPLARVQKMYHRADNNKSDHFFPITHRSQMFVKFLM